MAKDKKSSGLEKTGKRGKPASLSAEERALWEYAARDLKPFKGKQRVGTSEMPEAPRANPTPPERPALKHAPPPRKVETAKPKPLPAPPELTEIERRKARRISAGRIEIEARIDLHGMRQSEAHAALRRFLYSAHANDRRWVLVITGKGEPARSAWASDEPFDGNEMRERGVLRRNVPRWLAEPALRSIVVGYSTAAIRHGGEGALYVQLRRRERVGG